MVNSLVPAGLQRLKKLFFKITSRNSMQTSNVSELVSNIPITVLACLLNTLGQKEKNYWGNDYSESIDQYVLPPSQQTL